MLKRQAGVKSELQNTPHELYNIGDNTEFNIKATMIMKTKSETATVYKNIRIIVSQDKNQCNGI